MAEIVGNIVTTDEVTIRDVRSFIAGAEFPASATQLLNTCALNGANQYIRAAVSELPVGIYYSESDVIKALVSLGYT